MPKIYDIKLAFDANAVLDETISKVEQYVDFCVENDMPFNDNDEELYAQFYEYYAEMHLINRHSEIEEEAIKAVVAQKGYVIMDGNRYNRADDIVYEKYPYTFVWNEKRDQITEVYSLVDDPDVAMLMKLKHI